MKKYIKIENDVLFISQRLKEIDKDYYIIYSLDDRNYQVHVKGQSKNSYAFTIPFSCLDERTIYYALKTRRERQDEIIKEIDRENEKLQEKLIKQQVEKIKEALCQ